LLLNYYVDIYNVLTYKENSILLDRIFPVETSGYIFYLGLDFVVLSAKANTFQVKSCYDS